MGSTASQEDWALAQRIELWRTLDKSETTQQAIEALQRDEGSRETLMDIFSKDLSFGTAGLRAAMSFGFNRMNAITVQLASQGIAEYLCLLSPTLQTEIVAKTMRARRLAVLLLPSIVPTPLVPFAINLLGERAAFGVMITASHNPADDNGYKVYGANGCQINSPTDKEISTHISEQAYKLWDLDGIPSTNPDGSDGAFLERVLDEYIKSNAALVQALSAASYPSEAQPPLEESQHDPVEIVYTPLHGVGYDVVSRLTAACNFPPVIPVPSQVSPDAAFPTVALPNPEEGLATLKEAISFAEARRAMLVFANDPDADRFNFAERIMPHAEDGRTCQEGRRGKAPTAPYDDWRIFSGNEIAAILAAFLWRHRQAISAPGTTAFAAVKSCVSSKLLTVMAAKEGFALIETKTGFKNLANAAQAISSPASTHPGGPHHVFLAYEEAIGFMCNTSTWDKDGISALAIMTAIARALYGRGSSFGAHLESIYKEYGRFTQYNAYVAFENGTRSSLAFARLRERLDAMTAGGQASDSQAPLYVHDGGLSVWMVEAGGAEMVTMRLSQDGLSWITFRVSGTEPKVKFYSELHQPVGAPASSAASWRGCVDALCKDLLPSPLPPMAAGAAGER